MSNLIGYIIDFVTDCAECAINWVLYGDIE